MTATDIDVLVCTFRRPILADTLHSLAGQVLPPGIKLGVIVADNDDKPGAAALVRQIASDFPHALTYVHAPRANISIARNACLASSSAPWVAFIDDDEVAEPGWISALWACAGRSGADGIFGPARAVYPPGTPDWMVNLDYHSNIPQLRGGKVLTGHTCNALLRWRGTAWADVSFDLSRGRSGGEDTAFFFELARRGARFAACDNAIVHEDVAPARLAFGWLARRRFRMGQSYVSSAGGRGAQLVLGLSAAAKAVACGMATIVTLPVARRRNYWALRGALHLGVVAGCLSVPQPEVYGNG